MEANSTQALAITLMLIAFVLLGGTFAGGGILAGIGAVAFMAASTYYFLKCKTAHDQAE
jgi:O-antigen ligase